MFRLEGVPVLYFGTFTTNLNESGLLSLFHLTVAPNRPNLRCCSQRQPKVTF